MPSHEDLQVWKESMILVEEVYSLTSTFPKEEVYGLTSQIRRPVVSVPSNIAEGAGRKGCAEWSRFLYIAQGSLSELDTQLKIAERLQYFDNYDNCKRRIFSIRKMIANFIKSINK